MDTNTQMVDYRVVDGDGTRLPAGTGLKLDWREGRLYDKGGNQVARWESRDDERCGMLADYASRLSLYRSSASAGQHDADAAKLFAMRGESVLMDLGPADVHIPSAMSNFASGYKNNQPIADLVAPVVTVDKQIDDYWQFAREDAFQRALPMGGAQGSGVPEISPRVTNDQYQAKQRALGGYVSTELEANADAPLKLLQATTRRIMNALILEREIRVQSMARTSTNWDTSVVANLGAGFQWNGGASADPVKDLQTRIEASSGEISAIFMSQRVWHDFVRNPVVRGYYAYKSNTASVPTPQQMQAILELPPIFVGKMKYFNSSNVLDYVWGNDVVLVRQPEQLPPTDQEDVASLYTFRWNVKNVRDGAASGGFIVRQFYNQHRGGLGGLQVVVIHFDAEKFTSKYAGGLIQNAHQ